MKPCYLLEEKLISRIQNTEREEDPEDPNHPTSQSPQNHWLPKSTLSLEPTRGRSSLGSQISVSSCALELSRDKE